MAYPPIKIVISVITTHYSIITPYYSDALSLFSLYTVFLRHLLRKGISGRNRPLRLRLGAVVPFRQEADAVGRAYGRNVKAP